jgi:hypothetical protein
MGLKKYYHCHDVALFGYSERHPPLSVSYTQAAVTSGHKFLEEIISSWPQYRERVNFHRENKGISVVTELEVQTVFMFWRMYKRSVKNPATNWSIWYNFVKLRGDNTATLT